MNNGNGKVGALARLRFRVGNFLAPTQSVLLDQKDFVRALERERAQAERAQIAFVFVRLRLISESRNKNGHECLLPHLAAVVGERMRFTDVSGNYEEGIGVVLLNTPAESIKKIVQDIEARFRHRISLRAGRSDKSPEIACEIFYSANEGNTDKSNYRKDDLWPQLHM